MTQYGFCIPFLLWKSTCILNLSLFLYSPIPQFYFIYENQVDTYVSSTINIGVRQHFVKRANV